MKNNMKKIVSLLLAVLMMASMSVSALAVEFTGESATTTFDFKYTVTHEDSYTELSAVKLDWSVPVLKYVKTDVRTWNSTTLKWVQSYEYDDSADVSFTLTNYGTYAVKANVSFTPAIAGSASVNFGEGENDTNNPIIASIVGDAHALKVTKGDMTDEEYETAKGTYVKENCKAVIAGTVKVDDISKLTADSGKLGTYTVKLVDPTSYSITAAATNFTADSENAASMDKSTSTTLKYTAAEGYIFSTQITSSGVDESDVTYNITDNGKTAIVTVQNPTANVVLNLNAVEAAKISFQNNTGGALSIEDDYYVNVPKNSTVEFSEGGSTITATVKEGENQYTVISITGTSHMEWDYTTSQNSTITGDTTFTIGTGE